MLKKICVCFTILSYICLYNCNVIADDIDFESVDSNFVEAVNNDVDELTLNSRIAVVYDRTSGKVLWGKNENKRTAMASTTKIMTCIVVIENCEDLNKEVTISKKAGATGGSRLELKANDKITIKDLLYGLMLRSGNDSAVALAESIGGSVENFANLMNDKAKVLGLNDSHFCTPHGLDNPEHYTTAYELAKLADYALENELFAKIVNTKTYTIYINKKPKIIANTNELLGYIEGVNGVKTGFTNNAGRCLVSSVSRNEFNIITVVLQADTKKIRTSDSIKLINYVYSNYSLINLKEIVDEKFQEWCLINKNRFTFEKSKDINIDLYYKNLESNIIPIKNGEKDKIDIKIDCIYNYESPFNKNKMLGNMKVVIDDKIIDSSEIYNKYEIERKNVIDYIKIFLGVFKF